MADITVSQDASGTWKVDPGSFTIDAKNGESSAEIQAPKDHDLQVLVLQDAPFKDRLVSIKRDKSKKLKIKSTNGSGKKGPYYYVMVVETDGAAPEIAEGNSMPEFWIDY